MLSAAARSLSLDFPADLRAIRDRLRLADYTAEGLARLMGTVGLKPIASRNLPQIRAAAEQGGALGGLARVFLTRDAVSLAHFTDAVAPTSPEQWAKVGLVEIVADSVRGLVELRPHGGLVIANDIDEGRRQDVTDRRSDETALEQLAIYSGVRSAFVESWDDGLAAIAASAAGCDHVVAEAGSERGVQRTRFNALLNNAKAVEAHQATARSEALQGRQFELVVAWHGVVIPPADTVGDALEHFGDAPVAAMIRRAAGMLREGGHAVLQGEWTTQEGETEAARFARWLADLGCDAFVLRESTADPIEYAAHRLAPVGLGPESDSYAMAYRERLGYCERHRIQAIHSGVIVLRKRSNAPTWLLFETLPAERVGHCGETIHKLFQMQDYLRSLSGPQALLDVRLQLAPDVYLAQKCDAANGGWQIFETIVTRSTGLRFACEAAMPVAPIVPQLNGSQTLREMLPAIARQFRVPLDQLIAATLDRVVQLLIYGLVQPTPRLKSVIQA